jgi:hypothetical protein
MKKQRLNSQYVAAALALFCVLTLAGCASRGYKQADSTGTAISTVRNDVGSVKSGVDASLKALDGLAAAANTDPRKPYEAFAKSVDNLESAANTTKKHAADMRARGSAYFTQWQAQLNSVKSEDIKKLGEERKAKLQETFDKIKDAAEDAKQSFPGFLSDLKDLRTSLSADLSPQGIEANKNIFQKTKDSGAQVQKDLDKLIAELNSVAADMTAAKAPTKEASQPPKQSTPSPKESS